MGRVGKGHEGGDYKKGGDHQVKIDKRPITRMVA
jgi:hypothetical protein